MTGKAVLSNRIYLTKTSDLFTKCMAELVYKIPSNRRGVMPEIINDIVLISNKVFSIPIARTDLIPKNFEIIDKRSLEEVMLPTPRIELREDQQFIVDQIEDNCLINAKPGWGKTFTALHLAKKLKQKTLVIVHTTALRDQWEDETRKLLGMSPGIIGTNRFESDRPVVISNIQTLGKYMPKYANMFGTLIADEVHRVPASTFKKIVDASSARYKIGLSATLQRKDNKHIIIPDYFSQHTLIPENDTAVKPTIYCLYTNIGLDNSLKHWVRKVTDLCTNPDYIELITNLVDIKSNKETHKVLTVADRLEFLHVCGDFVENSRVVTSYTSDRMDVHRLILAGKVKSLFGTTSIYKEGISVNALSCLVLGCPINNAPLLEQLIGRVTRPHPGKTSSEVWDIVLSDKVSRRQFSQRMNYYMSKGYKIVEIHND
jgi:superfamily II DNA or RNA helicase